MLRNDYNTIAKLAHEKEEPVYITRNGEGDIVVMSIEAFERREAMLDLREKLLFAEQQRLSGEATISLDNAHKLLRAKINEKV
jgi:prevent-host-death family protein